MNILQEYRSLTEEERIEAQERARAIVVLSSGDKPTRDKFQDYGVSEYPLWFTRMIAALMAVVLVAAAMPSLFRLFTAGHEYFLKGIDDLFQASIVGVSTFLLAEFLIILSTISARVYFVGRARLVFAVPILLGLAMALVGNWTVAKPIDLFGWLETLVPPLAVLFIALIGERLVLDSIESRHANERAYQQALSEWQAATARPEDSPRYQSAYANALKAALIAANGRGSGATKRRELLASLNNGHWRALVERELRADEWYTAPESDHSVHVNPTILLREPAPELIRSNGNGHHS